MRPCYKWPQPFREVKTILPLLQRASHGIEFIHLSDMALQRFTRIRNSSGLVRFIEFLALLNDLAGSSAYQLLSTIPMQASDDDARAGAHQRCCQFHRAKT